MEGGFSRVVVPDKHGLAAMEKENFIPSSLSTGKSDPNRSIISVCTKNMLEVLCSDRNRVKQNITVNNNCYKKKIN